MRHVNDRLPNFYKEDRFFLVRCFACVPGRGRENYAMAAATGQCAFCGWTHSEETHDG